MKLAHIRSGEIIRVYPDSNGRVLLENGDTVSPPVAGYINGNDRIVPVEEMTVDNSTTTRTASTSVETVEDDRVLRTMNITDMAIEDIRAGLSCTKMQGVLTLGEVMWGRVIAFCDDDPSTTLIQKEIINSSDNWTRNSENIQFIGYLIGFNDEQMDAMFTAAALVEA
jgi:hypothetical protein